VSGQEVTLYKALGFGGLDLAALELALQMADARDLGVALDWAS
jgi:ornithine cyclodeaminase/alanine dehydrogenase-like protein (mu-crystallin family)